MKELICIIIAYCIGSIPTSIWISRRFFNIDIREYGSHNAGATNTFRVLGRKWGIIVMVVDTLKGAVATSLWLLLANYRTNTGMTMVPLLDLKIALGFAGVVGHIYPIWAGFKGGKGVATLLGMVIALEPTVALLCFGIFLIVLVLTNYVSVGSMIAGAGFALLVLFVFKDDSALRKTLAIVVMLLILFTHRRNLVRLLRNKETPTYLFKRKKKGAKKDNK